MIIQPDFLDHWKTNLLIELLNDPCAPLYVIRLWGHCQNRKTHRFQRVNPSITKAICKAPHEAVKFENALIESGFLRIENDEIVAHGWDIINASLIANWDNGKKGGRPKKKTHGLTQSKPTENPSVTDKRREEKIDKNISAKAECDALIESLQSPRREMVKEWCDHKTERRDGYKPAGLKALISKLSKYDDETIQKAIEDAMSANWKGLVFDNMKSISAKHQQTEIFPRGL